MCIDTTGSSLFFGVWINGLPWLACRLLQKRWLGWLGLVRSERRTPTPCGSHPLARNKTKSQISLKKIVTNYLCAKTKQVHKLIVTIVDHFSRGVPIICDRPFSKMTIRRFILCPLQPLGPHSKSSRGNASMGKAQYNNSYNKTIVHNPFYASRVTPPPFSGPDLKFASTKTCFAKKSVA